MEIQKSISKRWVGRPLKLIDIGLLKKLRLEGVGYTALTRLFKVSRFVIHKNCVELGLAGEKGKRGRPRKAV